MDAEQTTRQSGIGKLAGGRRDRTRNASKESGMRGSDLQSGAMEDEVQVLTRRGFAMLGAAGLLGVGIAALGLSSAAARELEPGDDHGGHGADDPPGDDNGGHGADDPPGDDNGGNGTDDPAGDDRGRGKRRKRGRRRGRR
jgi:hypothetical protein